MSKKKELRGDVSSAAEETGAGKPGPRFIIDISRAMSNVFPCDSSSESPCVRGEGYEEEGARYVAVI